MISLFIEYKLVLNCVGTRKRQFKIVLICTGRSYHMRLKACFSHVMLNKHHENLCLFKWSVKTLLQELMKNLIHYCSHLIDLEGVLRKADGWDRDEPKGASATRPCSCSSDNVYVHVMMQVWFARILKPCSRFLTSLSSNLDRYYLFSPLLFTPLGAWAL